MFRDVKKNRKKGSNENLSKKKHKKRKKVKKSGGTAGASQMLPPKVKTKKTKKDKKKKKSKSNDNAKKEKKAVSSRDISNSSSSSSDDDDQNILDDFKQLKQIYMTGLAKTNKPNPPDYIERLLKTERPDLCEDADLKGDEYVVLDRYLVNKGELRSNEIVVMRESEGDDNVKIQDKLMIVQKYSEGRYGAIYVVRRVSDETSQTAFMMMKTSLRQSIHSISRLQREIAALKMITEFGKSKDIPSKRIVPLLFESRVLGIPYFVMPLMDVNLEKMRQEIGGKFSASSSYFIAQEVLVGIKDAHGKHIVHRDIKPTNIVAHPTNKTQWFLIDFGDAIGEGRTFQLSPPDVFTLPYMSLIGHKAAMELVPSTLKMDIESWFYVLLDLLNVLPWKDVVEEESTINMKTEFWTSYGNAQYNLPTYAIQLADCLVKGTEYPYKEISAILKDGFEKTKTPDWKACWMVKRQTNVVNDKSKHLKTSRDLNQSTRLKQQ